jgi:hypothetical protein
MSVCAFIVVRMLDSEGVMRDRRSGASQDNAICRGRGTVWPEEAVCV